MLLYIICFCLFELKPFLSTVSDEEGLDHVNQVIEAKFALHSTFDRFDIFFTTCIWSQIYMYKVIWLAF